MKAIVCVKQVPDTSGKVSVKPDGTLDRASMATITNPDDLNALEAALKLKDATGCEVVVVTMGPPPAEGMLRELLARGADKSVLVSGREFGGSYTFATSQILAAAVNKIGVGPEDVVFCGRQAIDGDTAQVGPQIAEAASASGHLRGRHPEGWQHPDREAYAGGRLHDGQGADSLPADLHQGAERPPLHEREWHLHLLRQADGSVRLQRTEGRSADRGRYHRSEGFSDERL